MTGLMDWICYLNHFIIIPRADVLLIWEILSHQNKFYLNVCLCICLSVWERQKDRVRVRVRVRDREVSTRWMLCILKTHYSIIFHSALVALSELHTFWHLWQCHWNYYLAKITNTHNGDFGCNKTKANAGWGQGDGGEHALCEGACFIFSSGNVLSMLIPPSFLP